MISWILFGFLHFVLFITCTSANPTAIIEPIVTGVNSEVIVSQSFPGNIELPFCLYDWGDDEAYIYQLDDSASPSNYTYNYVNASYYDLIIICVINSTSFKSDNEDLYVGDAISGFSISNVTTDIILGVTTPLTSDVVVGLIFAAGTHVAVKATVLSSGSSIDIPEYNAPDPEYVTFSNALFPTNDMYAVEVNASNPLTSVTRHFVIALEAEIAVSSVTTVDQPGTSFYFIVDHDHVITTTLTGDNPVFTWWLMEESQLVGVFVEACDGAQTTNAFTIQHNTTGLFKLVQDVSNYVNTVETNLNVTFSYPVNNFSASLNKDIALYNDDIEVVVDVLSDAMLRMGLVSCEVSLDDGSSEPNLEFDLTTTDDYSQLTAGNKQQKTTPKQLPARWYYPTVKCYNGLPEIVDGIYTAQNFSLFLIVVNPVVNLVLSHNSPNISDHPLSEDLQLSLDLSASGNRPLANLTCVFSYDDPNSPINVTGDITFGNPLSVIIPFSLADKSFTITWNCSNELTHMSDTLDAYVKYDCWKPGFYFDEEVHYSNTPRIEYTNLNFTLRGDIQLKTPAVCVLPVISFFTVYTHNTTNGLDTLVINITEPDALSFHTFEVDTMQPVLHKIYLYSAFPDQKGSPVRGDFLFVRFILPDLQISLVDTDGVDNNKRRVIQSDNVVLDSYLSTDPGQNLANVAPVSRQWTCTTSPDITDEEIEIYFFSGNFSSTTTNCQQLFIDLTGSTTIEYYSFPGETFILGQWYVFKLIFSSGDRSTSKSVAIKTSLRPQIIAEQRCRKSCFNGTGDIMKLITGDLNVDLVIPGGVSGLDISSLTYSWSLQVFNVTSSTFSDVSNVIDNRALSGVQVAKGAIQNLTELGYRYFQLSCLAAEPQHEDTPISKQFVLNLPPYNGTCELIWESTNAPVGDDEITAASNEKVCMLCSGWKDEGKNAERGPQDGAGSLMYEVKQFFLFEDNSTDFTTASIPLAFTANSRNCFPLSLNSTMVNYVTLIEALIRDEFSEPPATVGIYARLKAPISAGINGTEGEKQVLEFAVSFNMMLDSALTINNTQSITSAISAGGSVVKIEGLESTTPVTVPENEFVAFLTAGEPTPDPTLVAIQSVNLNLTVALSSVTVTDATAGIQVTGALQTLSSSPTANMDLESKNNLVSVFATVTASTSTLNLAEPSSVDLVTSLVVAQGSMGSMLVKQTLSSSDVVSRDISFAEKEILNTNDDDQELTDDTKFFIAAQEQRYVELQWDEIKNTSRELERKFSVLTETVLDSTSLTISVGVQMTYGEGSDTIAVKKNKASDFGNSPIVSLNVQVFVEFENTNSEEDISVALSHSSNVLNLDSSSRAADAQGQMKFVTKTDAQMSAFKAVIQLEQVTLTTVTPIIYEEDASKFSYHKVLVKSSDDMLCITVQPTSPDVAYYVVWINKPDTPGVSKIDFVANEIANADNGFAVCFSPVRRGSDIGGWRVGIEGIMSGDDNSTSSNDTTSTTTTVAPVRRKRDTTNETYTLYPAYEFGVITTACMVWDEGTESWTSSTCDGKWNITSSTLECNCPPQKTLTFSNSFYVAANKIDFSSVFLKFSPLNQAAVMGTLAAILVIFVLVTLWARRNDKKDLLKWGITPLLDNFAEDNYFYVIRVFTGMRPNSGTRSRIGLVIAGEEMDTGIREVFDGVRKEFTTGSVMNFLLSTNMYLGDLEYIRLWHDNSGGGNFSSWYLSKIEVQDVQRNETFIFMAEKWLSVDDEDGSLECVLPVAKNENLNIFRNRFFLNAKSSLAESHIWVSVAYRPITSNFTRVQRASCALVFVMLTMITNAMYFQSGDEPNYETPAEVQVGPFRFSLQQVYTSLICALITTAATLVVIYLFKLSRNKSQPTEKVLFQTCAEEPQKKYKIPYVSDWLDREHRKSVELEKHLVEKGYPRFEGFYLPHWCKYIAWFLVFLAFVLSGFFLMLYSMEWGKQKSEEWLTTFFLSFFESVLCMDPVKVVFMALVFAILFRAASESSTVVDRQTIMRNYAGSHRGKSGGIRLPAPPLDHKRLEEERVIRLRELKMRTAFKDVLIQVFQIWILLSISFSNRDNKSYYMHKEIEESVLEPIGMDSFSGIQTVEQYYNWINGTAIPSIFPEKDYNGERLHWRLRQFTTGGAKFRVGPPRLRQVRVPKDTCKIPYMGTLDCYRKYVSHAEETSNYCVGWASQPCDPKDAVYKFSADSWQFTSALDIWGLPLSGYYSTYGGGGYISKLSVNREVSHLILNELYEYSWVDRQTRAVIFEMTLYCINVNIFTYNMFMIEFPETGGAFPFAYILPLRVYQHQGALGMYTLACEVIFLIFLLVMTGLAVYGIYKERCSYFSKPWQTYDFVFIIAGYVCVAMYIARMVMTNFALDVFREDKKEFVNFYHVALWDQILVLLIGILVFMAIFRLLNILGYNKRIGAVARVFTNAAGDLLWFGLFFLTIFTCYAVFGYLLFGAELSSYKNVYRTMGTLFISMIGKSRFTEIEDTDPIMSKIYFMIFIFFVVYMILTMFLAILSQSIDKVHEETKNDKGDEMVEYLMKKFKKLLGYGQGDAAGDNRARNLHNTAISKLLRGNFCSPFCNRYIEILHITMQNWQSAAGVNCTNYLVKELCKQWIPYVCLGQDENPYVCIVRVYAAQPCAPWNMKKGRKFVYDNRQILEDIRMSLTDAMNMDPKEFSTPEPDKKESKKLKKPRH